MATAAYVDTVKQADLYGSNWLVVVQNFGPVSTTSGFIPESAAAAASLNQEVFGSMPSRVMGAFNDARANGKSPGQALEVALLMSEVVAPEWHDSFVDAMNSYLNTVTSLVTQYLNVTPKP